MDLGFVCALLFWLRFWLTWAGFWALRWEESLTVEVVVLCRIVRMFLVEERVCVVVESRVRRVCAGVC